MSAETKKADESFDHLFELAAGQDEFWTATAIMEFTEALARWMEQNRISRSELAARIGVSAPYVTKILKGNVNFTIGTMVKLAGAVGASLQLSLAAAERPVEQPDAVQGTSITAQRGGQKKRRGSTEVPMPPLMKRAVRPRGLGAAKS
jgi:transcriptional regulator with XRE-family HTH domain